ncbi:MAG TPA: MXAN_6230/SCO0854 family RING domain-containing protein [Polyangia bacterium]|jgi:hypothetical protein
MGRDEQATVRSLLLTRRGLVFAPELDAEVPGALVRGVELELAELGFVASRRLRARLARQTPAALAALRERLVASLAAALGADQRHAPLFRSFPHGVPSDTTALWWQKVLSHFLQAPDQPCLFCDRVGTTHVLAPCEHVVCDRCFDGSSYDGCPVCEHRVDRASPFFQASPVRAAPVERVTFRLLDLGEDETAETRAFFVSLCERKQTLSPDDREALIVILRERGPEVLSWLPAKIPVRENVAVVFGTLFQACAADVVLPIARRYMTTATDVLRFIAVISGTDGSLQAEVRLATVDLVSAGPRFVGRIEALKGAVRGRRRRDAKAMIPIAVKRFKVARLRRPLRRALLTLLEEIDGERLIEDMLRHRSYWVWVGEFLHPTEQRKRLPRVARAFEVVRKYAPDGRRAPKFEGWGSRVEAAIARRDIPAMLATLSERPGELARRFDRSLRVAGGDPAAAAAVVAAFEEKIGVLATPVLLTLRSHLPRRAERAPVRVYWPKGRAARGVSSPDERAPLSSVVIAPTVAAIEGELLRRFSAKPAFDVGVIDAALAAVAVPFNERTASSSAVAVPRGSRLPVPAGKIARLFLHWCEPEKGGQTTDIDLSVAFYDEHWRYVGVCSYYALQARDKGGAVIATSAGDLRQGPWPDGATELVDLDCVVARAAGVRYAVMVVNNYCGMPFSQLARGFAGLMLRDDPEGHHFDPRTVALKFALSGENGIFMPLVFDVRDNVIHWLDVQAAGEIAFNNVASSNHDITNVCPALISYFASGTRPSMFELALLHAAARCRTVVVRGATTTTTTRYTRRADEDVVTFHARLVRGGADEVGEPGALGTAPVLAALFKGDVELPKDSAVYALFREQVTPSLAAGDLLT